MTIVDYQNYQYTPIWLATGFFWLLATLGKGLFWLYLWQLKEYRLDRVRAYFKTWQGKKQFFRPLVPFRNTPLVIK